VAKKLQEDSVFNQFDEDGDGVVTDEEMAKAERMLQIENDDKKQDAQRGMAWFAPLAIILSSLLGLETASGLLKDIAPTYFVSVAAIVAAFYAKEGVEGFAKKNG
jgi:hypothetical protein